MDRWVKGKWMRKYPKPEKKRALRSMINQVNPDIMLIQEMGDEVFLNELWMDLNVTNGVGFAHSARMKGSYERGGKAIGCFVKDSICLRS